MAEYQDNFSCDFCGIEIENTTCDLGSAYTNLGYDDRVACEDCCGNIKFEEGA